MKFRRKVYEVEAIQYDGTNVKEIVPFVGTWVSEEIFTDPACEKQEDRRIKFGGESRPLPVGSWIVKFSNHETSYSLKALSEDEFNKVFEPVPELASGSGA